MINRKTIYNTAFCRWDSENECYVVESPLFDVVLGVAESEGEAWKIYSTSLENAYEELKKENVAGYRKGRPTKGGLDFHCQIRPETKKVIDECRDLLGLSQGEFVDVAVFFYKHCELDRQVDPGATDPKKLSRILNEAAAKLTRAASQISSKAKSASTYQIGTDNESKAKYVSKRKTARRAK